MRDAESGKEHPGLLERVEVADRVVGEGMVFHEPLAKWAGVPLRDARAV